MKVIKIDKKEIRKLKIAITGITGFIGQYFSKTFNDENKYILLVRHSSNVDFLEEKSNIKVIRMGFSEEELEEALVGVDVVVHMIGQMGKYGLPREQFINVNCNLTKKILNACINNEVKQFIYLSTPGVQGFGKRLCVEEDSYAPRNVYEETKVTAERDIISTLKKTNVKYTILRPDFVYGPGDYRRIRMYKNIRDKKFVLTTSGKSYLHPTYVDDVVQGIWCSIANNNAYNQIFNISAKDDIRVREYLKTIADYFGVNILHFNIGYYLSVFCATIIDKFCNVILKREGFVSKNKIDFLAMDHSTSCKKAQELIGYNPKYDFKLGFDKTMEWYNKNNLM